jgi:UDP-GlcNAc:undecaprenyl-phosphate GlcNAc-1-phosphate transferase
MFDFVLSISLSFVICYFSIPAIITIAKLKKLYDLPEQRKVHLNPIASLGGVGIFASIALTALLTISFSKNPEFQYILAAAFIMFFLGIKDDILVISPVKKLLGQVLSSILLVSSGGVQIKNMHGFMGIQELHPVVSFIFSFFTIIVFINAFNLIDGVDGLASSLGIMASILLGAYFSWAGSPAYAVLSFCMAGSLVAFILYNFQPAKIFMGDTGSLTIGLISAVLVVKFINLAPVNPQFQIKGVPALAFSLVFIPLMDTFRVFALRIIKGRSPFSADRNHVHHYMLDKGLSHRQITLILVGSNLGLIVLCYLSMNLGATLLILISAIVYLCGIRILQVLPVQRQFEPFSLKGDGGTIQIKQVSNMDRQKKVMAE